MQNQTSIRDPSLQRLVQDFDALADLVQTLIDHDHLQRAPHETVPSHDTEFTTEWQMAPTEEEVYSG
jgi:hypothetical protein